MPTLEDAIMLAAEVHRGQLDKAGAPYILHPLRVMLQMQDDVARMAAVLHDVVEDSSLTLDDLRARGYPQEVLEAVDHLTHRPDEDYMDYIRRLRPNALARRVKLADLADNMDMVRLPNPTERDLARLQRYAAALKLLGE